MTVRDQVFAAAEHLAQTQPIETISLTDVAKAAGVSWPTVRRYLGNKQQLQVFLQEKQPHDAEAQPLDTRSRILEAARRVFARQGYAGATLDAIAADAGLTKGALYWHFPSKIDLFLALLEGQLQSPLSISPEQAQTAFSQHADSHEAVKYLLSGQLNYLKDNPDWCRLFFEFVVQSREADVQKIMSAIALQDRQTAINHLAQELQQSGILRHDVDPVVIVLVWRALVDGLALAQLIDPQRVDPAAVIDPIAKILWSGLQAQE